MDSPAGHSPSPKTYLFLNAAALLAAGALMILIASSGGFSSLRLILISGTFVLAALAAAAAILLQFQPEKERALHQAILRPRLANPLTLILAILFCLFWCMTWFPPQYIRDPFYYYYIGSYPLILYGTLASGSGLVFMLAARNAFPRAIWRTYWAEHRTTLLVTLFGLGAFAVIAILTAGLRILAGSEPFWYGTGVPLLASQVFATLIISALALKAEAGLALRKIPLDLALFFLIWVVSAILWATQPVPASFWVTSPRPPNWETYPFSDLVTFDIGSQFALIGQGINNGIFWDRALYMSFLVYLHSLGGEDYQQLMAIQAALFAIFPALMYVVGRKLHSRNAGIVLASLTAMRGVNSLSASAWIDTSTFKHMLTDFPTAIGLAIFLLLMWKWLEAPRERTQSIMWAAGVLGLSSLLRPHVLLLVPAVLFLAIWMHKPRWTRSLITAGVTLGAFVVSISPWMLMGPGSASIVGFYGQRIQAVFQQRYAPRIPTPVPMPALPAPSLKMASLLPAVPRFPSPATTTIPFPLAHFVHNIVTSALIFPDSPVFLPVKETVKGDEGLWEARWDGRLSPVAAAMLILNLTILSLGLGAAYQRLRWHALVPLAVLLIYDVANALARTSGGRYLVPTDWVLVCYYGVGLAVLIRLGQQLIQPASATADPAASAPLSRRKPLSYFGALCILAFLGLIGGLIPLAGVLYPPRYPSKNPSGLVDEAVPHLSNLGLNTTDVKAFLGKRGAVLLHGRALYPRYYRRDVGEPVRYRPYRAEVFPRTVFIVIGPAGLVYAILPGPVPKVLPNASDVFLLGCQSLEEGYTIVNVLAVALPGQRAAYARSPAAPLACPLPVPVCNSNGNCR